MSAVQDTLTHQAFTLGPWRALPCVKREGHTIYDEIGIVIANTGTHSAGSDEPGNARLIAAAPELYEALDLAYRGGMVDMAGSDFRDRVEAILAKVRGND